MDPRQAEQLAGQRQAARTARAQGRRWYLRAVLLLVIAAVALWRRGQLNVVLGVAMVVLAAMALSLGRSVRAAADAMEAKIDLMEKGAGGPGHGGTA